MTSPRYVLGLNKYDHDVSAVLLRDGVPIVGIPKERVTREKNDGGAPDVAVGYCLHAAGISLRDIALVVQNCYAMAIPELEHDLLSRTHALHLPPEEREILLASPLFRNPDAVTISHHLAHAYSAFAVSPFEEGAVMVVDGVGSHRRSVTEAIPAGDVGHEADRESESFYVFRGTEIEAVKKVWLPVRHGVLSEDFTRLAGLGAIYSRVSEYIFGHWNKCGEVMGLAPYGHDDESIPRLLRVEGDATWALTDWPDTLRHPYVGLGDGRSDWEGSEHLEHWQNLAWRVQDDLEEALLARVRWLHERTGMKNLVIAGGVALNCVANGRVAREGPFENVWVQPAAGDSGISVGCALYGDIAVLGNPRTHVMRSDFLGRVYPGDEIDEALGERPWKSAVRVQRPDDVYAETAKALAAGEVVGWFQTAAEFGPRALGHRSILCDPRDSKAKERLNARVKHRQAFRPFAPAVLVERAEEWFEPGPRSDHMLFVRTVREDKRAAIPAVVHVDGTARLQTVDAATNPEFHALISAFEQETGVPILVNTSFNVRGEPIVETPRNALHCFLATDMDVLVLDDRIIRKGRLAGKWTRLWQEVSRARQQNSVGGLLKDMAGRFSES